MTPKGRAWDEAKIKNNGLAATPIPARFMHQNFFDVIPSHKLIIAGNHKPKLKVVDEAIRARLLLIPFTVTIPEAERDPELYSERVRSGISGHLAAHDRRLLRIGGQTASCVPPAVRDASDGYFHEQETWARIGSMNAASASNWLSPPAVNRSRLHGRGVGHRARDRSVLTEKRSPKLFRTGAGPTRGPI